MSSPTEIATRPIALISEKIEAFIQGFFYSLPNLVAGLALIVLAIFAGRLLKRIVRQQAKAHNRPDLGRLLGSLASGLLMLVTLLFSAAIIFPSVDPADILATLGIGSVAIGFAFKDILQNLLAGILLLVRRPFKQGDQIVVEDFEGTVEHIESRATLIKTYDGRRVIIPNAEIYTSPVVVNTAFDQRRDDYLIGIGYGDDPAAACRAFEEALAGVDGVLADPPPQVLPWEIGDSSVNLKARWWAKSSQSDQTRVRARAIEALFAKAGDKGIDLPYPTQMLLFHDQTEESDGDRTRQREGWPAGDNPPQPRRLALAKAGDADD